MRTFQTSKDNKKKNKIDIKSVKIKLAYILLMIVLALLLLVFRLFNLQNNYADKYNEKILSQQRYDSRDIPYKRGEIRDRNGNILARSLKVYNLVLDPVKMLYNSEAYLEPTIDLLFEVFSYDKNELYEIINKKENSSYVVYEKAIDIEKKNIFEERAKEYNKNSIKARNKNRINGVWFEEDYVREYPHFTLASSVIGFSNAEGSFGTGGIEQYYNQDLVGILGREYGYLNEESNLERVVKKSVDGNNIISTIDVNIQKIVEEKISDWENEAKSKISAVLIMDPQNGEILSLATSRKFNLNKPQDLSYYYSDEEILAMDEEKRSIAYNTLWRNFVVSDTFEPGSPSKVFTVASAISMGTLGKNHSFFCDGGQRVGKWNIRCVNREGHGKLDVSESLMVSCNDAMMQIVHNLGKDNFVDYMDKFGFGKKTGVDLPSEADTSNLVYTKENMGITDLYTNSFGQNYNTTMIQVASAMCSAINGGNYYEPHIVKKVLSSNDKLIKNIDPKLIKKTITKDTSKFLNEALEKTVEEGTGSMAKVNGYKIGGKTGTAQKLPRGNGKYVVSFIGFAPVNNPKVLCYVLIDEPGKEEQARSSYASTLFANIMKEVLPYMGIYPENDLLVEDINKSEDNKNIEVNETNLEENLQEETKAEVKKENKKKYETEEYIKREDSFENIEVEVEANLLDETESVIINEDELVEEIQQ